MSVPNAETGEETPTRATLPIELGRPAYVRKAYFPQFVKDADELVLDGGLEIIGLHSGVATCEIGMATSLASIETDHDCRLVLSPHASECGGQIPPLDAAQERNHIPEIKTNTRKDTLIV